MIVWFLWIAGSCITKCGSQIRTNPNTYTDIVFWLQLQSSLDSFLLLFKNTAGLNHSWDCQYSLIVFLGVIICCIPSWQCVLQVPHSVIITFKHNHYDHSHRMLISKNINLCSRFFPLFYFNNLIIRYIHAYLLTHAKVTCFYFFLLYFFILHCCFLLSICHNNPRFGFGRASFACQTGLIWRNYGWDGAERPTLAAGPSDLFDQQ